MRVLVAVCLVLVLEGEAQASDPLNSSDKPTNVGPGATDQSRTEFNLLPVAGGTTDIGFGAGFFGGLARIRPGFDPYLWNVESAGLLTMKIHGSGAVVFPYQDVYVKLTVPRFLGAPLTLELRPSYTWETTLNYFGIGNASSASPPPGSSVTSSEYGRLHPEMTVDLRVRIADHLAGRTGIRYAQNWEQVAAHSRLAYDLANGSAEVRKLLGSIGTHSVAALTYGLQWDSRDNEVSTHAGVFASVDVLFSPGGVAAFPYQYARTMATASFFVPISNPRVTLAVRVVGDALFGNPPFYELARFDNTYALGGANGVRGVPAQRYYGKLKAFGNVELRTDVVSFRAFDKPLVFGVVGFFDGGRLWADTQPHPELDGTGLGLKYGVGGGLRLQSGTAFVLRADIAWSPDATPIGGYFSAGQLF